MNEFKRAFVTSKDRDEERMECPTQVKIAPRKDERALCSSDQPPIAIDRAALSLDVSLRFADTDLVAREGLMRCMTSHNSG